MTREIRDVVILTVEQSKSDRFAVIKLLNMRSQTTDRNDLRLLDMAIRQCRLNEGMISL